MTCRNPFFIRSVFVLFSFRKDRDDAVAIPFSSGLCSFEGVPVERADDVKRRNPFFIRSVFVPKWNIRRIIPQASQSLFHQVCVRSESSALGVCQKLGSQSLFHQVCVRSPPQPKAPCRGAVAIPFSSGLCSFEIPDEVAAVSRNPFFIRSVFVRRRSGTASLTRMVAIPFSSGLCSFITVRSMCRTVLPSQSLFHQVCVRSPAGPPGEA